MLAFAQQTLGVAAAPRATEFALANGMQVVVIPDHRAPVVTHMVWYRVGAADEPAGTSGIAHFLEHLMFKSTEKIPMGEFSKIVARLGGQDNAFTGHDATAYFQRVAKDRLATVMGMEADRMINLRLTEKEVLTERDVILEERRSRIENSPTALLDEQMDAMLYMNHHYGIPVIGWEHEMAKLSPHDAMSFYKRYYAPNNAILIVAGDVTADEVRKLAEDAYGKIAANPAVSPKRARPSEPPQRSARRLEMHDARAGKTSLHRYYYAPSYVTAKPGEAEAIDILMKVLASGSTSRLYKKLVMEDKIASSSNGWYMSNGMDSGKLAIGLVLADGADVHRLESTLDAVIADVAANGITEAELARAKSGYIAEYIYESDSQATLARRYGWGLIAGQSLAQIESWPDDIAKVTAEDVKRAASTFLDPRKSVTGILSPETGEATAATQQRATPPRPGSPLPPRPSSTTAGPDLCEVRP